MLMSRCFVALCHHCFRHTPTFIISRDAGVVIFPPRAAAPERAPSRERCRFADVDIGKR